MNEQEVDEMAERRSAIRLEQHIGTILQVIVVGLLAWSLKTTVDTNQKVAVLEVQVASLQATLNQGTADRYRGADAARDFKAIWDEAVRHEKRMDLIEKRVHLLEDRRNGLAK